MKNLSPAVLNACKKYVGPDGKLLCDETVPENLRKIFQDFNDNGVNIFDLDSIEVPDYSDVDDEYQDADNSNEYSIGSDMPDEGSQNLSSLLIDENEDDGLSDIDSFFA